MPKCANEALSVAIAIEANEEETPASKKPKAESTKIVNAAVEVTSDSGQGKGKNRNTKSNEKRNTEKKNGNDVWKNMVNGLSSMVVSNVMNSMTGNDPNAYDRPPLVCFGCGQQGHIRRFCPLAIDQNPFNSAQTGQNFPVKNGQNFQPTQSRPMNVFGQGNNQGYRKQGYQYGQGQFRNPPYARPNSRYNAYAQNTFQPKSFGQGQSQGSNAAQRVPESWYKAWQKVAGNGMNEPVETEPGPSSDNQGGCQPDPTYDMQIDGMAHLNGMATTHR